MYVIDIETRAIEAHGPCLPEPVGVAIKYPSGESVYLSWAHPSGNNALKGWVAAELQTIWDKEWLTHNGCCFDVPVLAHHFGFPQRPWHLTHDTLFLSFLNNPHERSLSLKDMAHEHCGMAPTEQHDLQTWILENTPCKSRKQAGAYIADAPAELVAPYAIGDVERTWALWQSLRDRVLPSMQQAYDRERRLAPILVGVQNQGLRVDMKRLKKATAEYEETLERLDNTVRTALNAPGLSLDSDADLVLALQANGVSGFGKTATGKTSAAKGSLDAALADNPELRETLATRSTIATCLSTFMRPWVEQAGKNSGRLHAAYNQVRNPDGYGTRTGRMSSSSPNLQNVQRDTEGYFSLRSVLLPEPGHVWVTGDFKSQEPRIAAHFEDGALLQAYKDNPELDQYLWIAEMANVSRKQAKVIFLALLYGMGLDKLAAQLGVSRVDAEIIRKKVRAALPGIVNLNREVMDRFKRGLHIRTLGGRIYHCEPPKNGMTFEYKALNVLVQGSAADQGKEAVIYIHDRLEPGERILGMVHDEISVSCLPERVEAIKQLMREAACALPCDAPMLMDCGHGNNWSEAK